MHGRQLCGRRCVAGAGGADLARRLRHRAENRQVRQLYLATMLEEAVDRRGLAKGIDAENEPVAREAGRLGVAAVNDASEYASANRLVGGAIGRRKCSANLPSAGNALHIGASPAPARGTSGVRPRPPRPHGGPGGDRGPATGRLGPAPATC